MATTAEELKAILETSDGVFVNKKAADGLPTLVTIDSIIKEFDENINSFVVGNRPVSFAIAPIPIAKFIAAIKEVREEQSAKQLSHLGVFYGLSDDNEMVLTMRGVKFDTTDNGKNLHKPIPRKNSSDLQFTTLDVAPHTSRPSDARPIKNFLKAFARIHGGEDKFVIVAYLKFDPLMKQVQQLQANDFIDLKISFGFIKAKPEVKLNCFHLIFSGLNKDDTSERGISVPLPAFSTLDSDPGYNGPKPGCPPFGTVEDGVS